VTAPAEPSIELHEGLVLSGRYRLERRVGEGGMGIVWAATHVITRKSVALKFLSPSLCRAKAGSDPGGQLPLVPTADADALRATGRLRARLDLPTGSLWDIAGNLSEYMLDAYATEADTCWADTKIYVNPKCDTPTPNLVPDPTAEVRSVRGGTWSGEQRGLRAAARDGQRVDNGRNHEFIGFRCVRPAL
jgi:hypothetical protein